jgi:hypothetical protein
VQLLPELFAIAAKFYDSEHFTAASTVYQIDSVNRTLFRSGASSEAVFTKIEVDKEEHNLNRSEDSRKSNTDQQLDESQFRSMVLDTQVLTSHSANKWRWDIILKLIEGPLLNPKRLEEAVRATKFMKRIMTFFRPFKYRYAELNNTKPNQRYTRVGCALIRTLLQTSEGVKYLAENKLLRQMAECLAQYDRVSVTWQGLCSPGDITLGNADVHSEHHAWQGLFTQNITRGKAYVHSSGNTLPLVVIFEFWLTIFLR